MHQPTDSPANRWVATTSHRFTNSAGSLKSSACKKKLEIKKSHISKWGGGVRVYGRELVNGKGERASVGDFYITCLVVMMRSHRCRRVLAI